jgi:hypothetical protein
VIACAFFQITKKLKGNPMKPSKLYEALHALIGERVPLHIWGACGVGKSQIVHQVADDLYLPGVIREGVGEIAIAVDCSGSVNARQLALFEAEVRSILEGQRPQRVHVLYFDSEVQKAESRADELAYQAARSLWVQQKLAA